MDALRKSVSQPLLSRLHGSSEWEAEITVQKKLSDVLVTSNLSGLVSDLPAPFAKDGEEVIPLRFEMKSMIAKQDVISLQYGSLLSARMLRREEGGDMVIKRGTVNFGGAGKWLSRDGVWVTGTVPHLTLQGWGGLTSPAESEAAPFTIAGADLTIQKLDAYGLTLNGLHVNARNHDGVLTAKLAGKEMNGEVGWQAEGQGQTGGALAEFESGRGRQRKIERQHQEKRKCAEAGHR